MSANRYIEKYLLLITKFVDGEITASRFEDHYLNMFKNETEVLPERFYNILNDLFIDVDSYCGNSELRNEGDLDEDELLVSAKAALAKLA